jgi:hypothetical protein
MPLHQKPFFAALGMIIQRTEREAESADSRLRFIVDRVDDATRIQRPDRAYVDHRGDNGPGKHGTVVKAHFHEWCGVHLPLHQCESSTIKHRLASAESCAVVIHVESSGQLSIGRADIQIGKRCVVLVQQVLNDFGFAWSVEKKHDADR